MSYRIFYYSEKKRSFQFGIPIGIGIILLVLSYTNMVNCIAVDIFNWRDCLLPWRESEIRQAFSDFTDEMQSGRPIIDCVETFWEEIFLETNEDS